MAKKATNTTETEVMVEEAVAPVEIAEPIKNPTIISKDGAPLRKIPSLESKYIIGNMTAGLAYEIVGETSSKIYGDFYQLENGYFVTKSGNYTIS